ncbi:MAG: glycosyltransferase family protein [Alcanivorax jadensis]|uniref:glycosyltransferase n=1 Tax=Alcanivorax jadensis TaxID=64988 RepID=UPI00300221D3|tara:strand:+ start:645 stop:1817 length:1173 start_codon:yes stop_codon:yes gene_type:complete
MATILFCWEMGEGMGHLMPVRKVLKALVEQGHDLVVAAVEVHTARRVLGSFSKSIVQAPSQVDKRYPLGRPAEGVADLLSLNGFADNASLKGRHHAWCQLATLFKPDLVITEHSPGALLMARALCIPVVHVGTGFTLPPEQFPICFPGFAVGDNGKREQRHLDVFNKLICATGGQPLKRLSELFNAVAERYLLSFAELDHLGPREGVPYMGVEVPEDGERPVWPDAGQHQVFAYLKPFAALEGFLTAVNALKLSLLLVPDRIDPAILRRHKSSNIRVVEGRQSMKSVTRDADLIVCNGNHGTAAAAMLGGVPSLSFPLHQEQEACARRVASSSLGAMLPVKDGKAIPPLLETMLRSRAMQESCDKAASRYQGFDYQDSVSRMVREIGALL